jgi:hypothetical protein
MKCHLFSRMILSSITVMVLAGSVTAGPRWVTPLANNLTYYRNIDDNRRYRGSTLQVISINEFRIGTNFIIEFTGDFNWDLDLVQDRDYYIELSLVKPIIRGVAFNYQRIYGTFACGPINQFGVRVSLFSGS